MVDETEAVEPPPEEADEASAGANPGGYFSVGAGYSTHESFIATAQISQNNLFGRGQSLSFQGQVSAIRTMFNVQFSEPWLFDSWQEAFEELLEFFEDLNQAGMISNYSLTDYRIVELTNTAPEETIPS